MAWHVCRSYQLCVEEQYNRLSHLGLTVFANGTRFLRLLALSGAAMAWHSLHAQVRFGA
jgi:hypothetical protein